MGEWSGVGAQPAARPYRIAILSNAFWKSRFGGSRDVVNQTVSMNGEPYTIVGVMPAGFEFPLRAGVNYNDTRLDYAAALSRISARYQQRF